MAKIPEETIEQIAAANDIVEIIGGYIPLKRAGSNFRALCPFHQEKTPSFNVNPQRQSYHCFGCGVGGSVFKFVMAYENIDFPSAARKLADRAGIKIIESEFSAEEDQRSRLRRRLLSLHLEAAAWFHQNLLKTEQAKAARDYLKNRGLNSEIAKAWKIGYAPDAWDALSNWAASQGFTQSEIRQSGLVSLKDENNPESDFYDRFRDRVMFPICNDQGEVIALSGRVLQADAKAAKYVNSPETPLFTKGNVLFGLHKSKRALIDKGFAIVCEGQIDLISAFEAGVQNVIAPQGTAFTEKQTRLLKRHVEEVVLCFDSDSAGQKATERSLASLLGENLLVRVAELPQGEDPDSIIRKMGAEAFVGLIEKARDFFDFQIDRFAASPEFSTARGKTQFARKMAGWASLITDSFLREAVSNKIATRIEISATEFVKLLKQALKDPAGNAETQPSIDISNLDPTVTNLVFAALTNNSILNWLREQDWKHLLGGELGCDLLIKILSSPINLEEPTTVTAFRASLSSTEDATVSRIIELGVVGNTPLNMRRIDINTTLEPEDVIQYQGSKDHKGRQRPPVLQNIQRIARDCWNSLLGRQIKQRLDVIAARLRLPNLQSEEFISLQKEVLDLQKQLTDIARPFSATKSKN